MKVILIETFGRGGLIHYAHNLARALDESGHRVTLVTGVDYELQGEIHLPGGGRVDRMFGKVTDATKRWLPRLAYRLVGKFEAIRDAFAVARLVRRSRPDIVHFHSTNLSALVFLKLLSRLDPPLVHTAHSVTPHESFPFYRALYRRIYRLGDLVVAHSSVDRDRLVNEFSVEPERVVVIPHGEYGFFRSRETSPTRAEARSALGLAADDEVALFFGYIRAYKGLDLLFDAWPQVRERRPRARLIVAGDPARLDTGRRKSLEKRAAGLCVIRRFEYIPFSDVALYFVAADVLVLPYRRISQSGVLFLGLSMGVPVIATAVGGLVETLQDGVSGLLVPPESPSALACALVRTLGDQELRAHLADGGRRVAAAHGWPAIADKTVEAYRELLSGLRDSI